MGKRALPAARPVPGENEFVETSLMLERIVRRINAPTIAILKEHDLTLEQWRILDCLVRRREMPMTELAEAVVTPPPSVTRAVDKLVASALVYRSSGMNDRRRVLVHPSHRGEELHTRLAQQVVGVHDSVFDALSREELEEFVRLARQLQAPG